MSFVPAGKLVDSCKSAEFGITMKPALECRGVFHACDLE